jgi:hypothetical protein
MADAPKNKPRRAKGPPMPQALKDKLKSPKYSNELRENIADLPSWVKVACVKYELMGLTWREAAEEMNKKDGTLRKYAKSPAVKKWREEVRKSIDDPRFLADVILRASEMEASLDYLWALDKAKQVGDYKEVRLATKDLLASAGILKLSSQHANEPGANIITINLQLPPGLKQLEAPTIESDFSVIEVTDIEFIDD